MGDSTCLMQPFSYTAGLPNEAKEGNPIHGLGQSISFGRFMSESLAWEKWSTFSHNKYVEEAERYARPGSVAQKKAFFEAHYKTLAARKAAALLEQANAAAATNATESEAQNPNPQMAETGSIYDCKENNSEFVKVQSSSVDEPQVLLENNMKNEAFEKNGVVVDKAEITDLEVKETIQVKNNCVKVNQSRLLGDDKELELSEGTQMEKPLLKVKKVRHLWVKVRLHFAPSTKKWFFNRKWGGKTNEDEFEVTSKMKPSQSSSKVFANARTSNMPSSPAKFKAPLRPNNGNNLTPMTKKSAMDISERKRSTPKSSHKSINFTHAKEFSKFTSTIIRKIDGSRIDSNSKASKECPTPLRTPNQVSISGKPKQSSATPWTENRSARTPVNSSASVSKTARGKWNFLPTDCSKILSACRNKSQSPGIFASFNLRTEERAARRKQARLSNINYLFYIYCVVRGAKMQASVYSTGGFVRLEEKFNVIQEQKVQEQTTLKEKAGTEFKKLRQSFCFKARPLPDFYKERTPKDQIQKVPLTKPESPGIGRKSTPCKASIVESKSSVPPHRKSSIKNNCFMHVSEKKNRTSARSLSLRIAMSAHENTSPNIQHA
ncbi:protein WVD2-like 7 [Gossypium australe]|uniref:Protein WVD2-like 7 n=1 Tax=Gossypium australe TaxID=47621 RepID=A0A5B6UR60_9ROSI|nr:protein WVD2-like 7 [Gossypium australe]